MTPEQPNDRPAARKWERLPGPIRLKLGNLIADHLRTYGSANYDELRDLPEFSPWFGTHLGHRGEKRFDRMVRVVKQTQPLKTARRSLVQPHPSEQHPDAPPEGAVQTVAKQLARGGAMSFEELQRGLADRLREIKFNLAACLNEFGEITDPGRYDKLLRAQRDTTLAIAQLSKQYHDALTSPSVMEPIVGRMLSGSDGEEARRVAADVSDIIELGTGLGAIRKRS